MVGKIRDFNVKRESGGQERPVETPKRPARASRGVGGLGGATRRGPLQRMQERDPQGGSGAEARGGRAGRRGRAACGSRPSAEQLPCTRHPPVGRERVRGAARWGRLPDPAPFPQDGCRSEAESLEPGRPRVGAGGVDWDMGSEEREGREGPVEVPSWGRWSHSLAGRSWAREVGCWPQLCLSRALGTGVKHSLGGGFRRTSMFS